MIPTTERPIVALEPAFELQVDLHAPLDCGPRDDGRRLYYDVVGGWLRGTGVTATIAGGQDVALLRADRFQELDVTLACCTADGAHLLVRGRGLAEISDAVLAARDTGEGTGFADQYYRGVLWVETGDERYAALTRAVYAYAGRVSPGATGRGIAAVAMRLG